MPGAGYTQRLLFPGEDVPPNDRDRTASTFLDNMALPVHRWFRYSAGFSAEWVEGVIAEAKRSDRVIILDPFAGAGTTLIAAEKMGVQCFAVEAHPFVARVARAKLLYRTDLEAYVQRAREVRHLAARLRGQVEGYPALIRKCFSDASLVELDQLRRAWEKLDDKSPPRNWSG